MNTETERLEPSRQPIVSNAVADALAAVRPTPILPNTRARGETLVEAGAYVSVFLDLTPRKVDIATDTVVIGFRSTLDSQERTLLDSAVLLGDPQREARGRIRLLKNRLFPNGTAYLKESMDLQWGELVKVRATMLEPEVAAAIDAQGLRVFADHLLAHVALYGRVVGSEGAAARAGEKDAFAAWATAMKMFEAQVNIDYEHDAAMQRELLGSFRAQLEAQRAANRAARKAAAAARESGATSEAGSVPGGAAPGGSAPAGNGAPVNGGAPDPNAAPNTNAAPAANAAPTNG